MNVVVFELAKDLSPGSTEDIIIPWFHKKKYW